MYSLKESASLCSFCVANGSTRGLTGDICIMSGVLENLEGKPKGISGELSAPCSVVLRKEIGFSSTQLPYKVPRAP